MTSKIKRSERIALLMLTLSNAPNKLFTLTALSEQFDCAKSTLSEDIAALKTVLERSGMGRIQTVFGAAGGVRFLPFMNSQKNLEFVQEMCELLSASTRIMPGGFLYTVDAFSDPSLMRGAGEIIARLFYGADPDVVVTVESSGVPIGMMTAQALGKPLVVARKENRITYGSVVTLNYITTSSKQLQTMSLPRRSITEGQKALIVDDFTKGGGTLGALRDMMREFSVRVVGVAALIEAVESVQKRKFDVTSLMQLYSVDEDSGRADLRPADWLAKAQIS